MRKGQVNTIINIFINAFIWTIDFCYKIVHNYWISIIIFTFLTKFVLMPLSIWVQKNSIKTVQMQPELNEIKAAYFGSKEIISEKQYKILKKYGYNPFADLIPLFVQLAILMGVVEAVKRATPLTLAPIKSGGITLIIPFFAAASSFFMCYVQNKINVLQSEQGRINKYGTMFFSVALSLYLGFFVSIGVGFYWICSNLFSILQLILLNILINPKKYIDYDALEISKAKLLSTKELMISKNKFDKGPYKKREREDYKRFLNTERKKVVFYSEKNGFYKYYKNIIEKIIEKTNIVIHYLTSDPEDEVFNMESQQFKPYYISDNKMIILMMKLECDIMVMTTPDLDNFQLKRSYVDKNIEYIYIPHDVNSANLSFRKEALDHFDTIFTSGFKNKNEIMERENKYGLKKKKYIEWGSSVIDNMIEAFSNMDENGEKTVLIAPSWQKDNVLDLCIEELLEQLKEKDYKLIVRPHPQYVRHYENRLDMLANKYSKYGIEFQKDFSSNETVYSASVLITDWSSIAFEYSFSVLKPVLFIDTPMKILNQDYKELNTTPIDIELRNEIGISIKLEDIKDKANETIKTLLYDGKFSKDAIKKLRDKYIYNIGKSGEIGADYIINRLIELQNMRESK